MLGLMPMVEQAVILAGGLGTRMRPMTEQVPKPMLPVNGAPFLEHQLLLLKRHGFERALLLVAYLGEQIEKYFGDGSKLGMSVAYSYEPQPLGTGGALKLAEAKLEQSFAVLNGDTYLDIDYRAAARDFAQSASDAMIVAYANPQRTFRNNLSLNGNNRVAAYVKNGDERFTHVDAGVTYFRRSVLELIPANTKCSLEQEVFPQLIAEHRMMAWPTSTAFIDMGSPAGLAALEEQLQ
jgi:N-acetyl-alpha-D-muramate 1-phosphate uridylyltransferase